MADIKDVAREAGVSVSTVSYVLSRKRPISEATRKRVKLAIQRLGYRPDARGRSLGAMRTGVVGLIAPPFSYFATLLLWGIDQALRAKGYRLLLTHGNEDDDLFSLYEKGQVDGVIFLVPGVFEGRWVGQIQGCDVPFVVVNRIISGLPCVRTDYLGGTAEGVTHLIGHGHRRIGFVGDDPKNISQVVHLEGYRQALRRHGIEPDPAWIAAESDEALSRWASHPESPTAAFLAGEQHIFSFYCLSRERGVRIPEGVAVVGFGDDLYDAALSPPLTTLVQPYRAVGAEAVSLLFENMENMSDISREVQIPARLVVRESCGSHASSGG